MKILVAGWFSFEQMGATAGDLLACEVVSDWLHEAGCPFDVARVKALGPGVDWQTVEPTFYSHVVFVCGPFGNGWPIPDFLDRFRSSRLIGVDLSMLQPLDEWNPFDLLLERDSSRTARPDISFAATPRRVPVVGVILVHPQKEYTGGRHAVANAAIERLVKSRELAVVRIDTRLDQNGTGLRTAAEVESLISRMDLVLTTRLHGLVLGLKHGVPTLAIDPIAGGAKIRRQAETIGWPVVFTTDQLDEERLEQALQYCLTQAARAAAQECHARAVRTIEELRATFLAAFNTPQPAKVG